MAAPGVYGVGRSGLEVGGHQSMEFKASRMDEILREWILIEKQPEDQALQLSSVMESVEQEMPKKEAERKQAVWVGMGAVW